jgi:anti-sigma B factor antagonist
MSENSTSSVQRFNLSERDLRPGCRDIQVTGELDLAVADKLDEVLDGALDGAEMVLIDLQRCDFIDSSGLAVILRAQKRMVAQGRHLAVYGPSDQVLRILSMTGLTANGLVYDNAGEALAALDGGL